MIQKVFFNADSKEADGEGFPTPSATNDCPNIRVIVTYKTKPCKARPIFQSAGLMATYWDGRKETKSLREESAKRFIRHYSLDRTTSIVIKNKINGYDFMLN